MTHLGLWIGGMMLLCLGLDILVGIWDAHQDSREYDGTED